MVKLRIVGVAVASLASVLVLGACSGGSTPAPSAPSETFTGKNAAFCDGAALLVQGEKDTQASPGAQALQQITTGIAQMAANIPADAPANIKSAFQELAADLAKATANPSLAPQLAQQIDESFGPEVDQYIADTCPSVGIS